MADYGGIGGGQSLRDALNQLYPMTGAGEYNAMFPPNIFPPGTGAPQPTPPVPLPQPRPPMAPQMAPGGLPPGLAGAPGLGGALPPGLAGPPGLGGGLPPGLANAQIAGGLQRPQIGGGMNVPLGPNLSGFAGGRFGGGQGYAAGLGFNRTF